MARAWEMSCSALWEADALATRAAIVSLTVFILSFKELIIIL